MPRPSLRELLKYVALEAQRPSQVDARIAKLTAERDSLKQRCEFADQGIAEAKAEIKRLCGKCESEELCKGYLGLCAEAEVVVKSIKADAEIGRLVRNMRPGTQLRRLHSGDIAAPGWSTWECNPYEGRYYVFVESSRNFGRTKADPAEVLRAIQKEANAD